MKNVVVGTWDALMDSRHNPLRHLDLASQHYFMQVLGWMWSMVFSLSFLSVFQFGVVWAAHLLIIGGVAMTVALFKESEKQQGLQERLPLTHRASAVVWRADSEA
jgi:hypothetical protein